MFKSLIEALRIILVQFAETKYSRLLVMAAVIIPLVLAMYGYFDTVLLDSKQALNQISTYSITNDQNKSFPVGAYTIAYMNVAKVDTCLTIVFGYIATAVVWSFTTDLKPMFVRK